MSPLHTGTGEGLGVVDRPLLREVATGYPTVQGPSLKGALRSLAQGSQKEEDDQALLAAFGPRKESGGNGHEGCVSFGDARLLLLPVRSLAGVFAWVTSPLAVARLARDLGLLGGTSRLLAAAQEVVARSGPLRAGRGATGATDGDAPAVAVVTPGVGLCLEDLVLECATNNDDLKTAVAGLAARLAEILFADDFWQTFFRQRLVLAADDDFRHLVATATEVRPNIAVGEAGTTTTGSLRITEYLPEETVLTSLLIRQRPFLKGVKANEVEVLLDSLLPVVATTDDDDHGSDTTDNGARAPSAQKTPAGRSAALLQLGADESTGKGLVRLIRLGLDGSRVADQQPPPPAVLALQVEAQLDGDRVADQQAPAGEVGDVDPA